MTPVTVLDEGWAAIALVLLLTAVVPGLLATLRGDPLLRLAGLVCAGDSATLLLLLLAAAYRRPAYLDVALVPALLSPAGTLVYTRFLGRTM